jgi:hypothetical protein
MESEKQLQLIEEMISTAKGNLKEGSIFYLIWGWLVLAAALLNYSLLNYTDYVHHWIGWPVLMSLGAIISGIVGFKMERKRTIKTYVDRAIGFLWVGFGATLLVLIFSMMYLGVLKTYPILILLYGLGTFVSGGILKFKPLIIGGILCWIIGAIAVHANFSQQLLLIALAMIVSYIIPGHLLAAKPKKYV